MIRRWIPVMALGLVTVFSASSLAAQRGWCGHHPQGWRGGGAGIGGAGRGFGAQAPARLYNPATVATLSGTISAVAVQPARPGRVGGMHVTLNTDGKTMEVHMGPAWFAQAEGLVFTKGEKMEVTGSVVTRGEQTFLIAREVKSGDKLVKLRETDGRPLWAQRRRG